VMPAFLGAGFTHGGRAVLLAALISLMTSGVGNAATLGISSAHLTAATRLYGAPVMCTLTAVADSYVSAAEAARNFGTRSTLRTDASPDIRSYLRFNLTGLGGEVLSATLRVFAVSGNALGVDARSVGDNAWGETLLTYGNQPGMGAVVGSSGRITRFGRSVSSSTCRGTR